MPNNLLIAYEGDKCPRCIEMFNDEIIKLKEIGTVEVLEADDHGEYMYDYLGCSNPECDWFQDIIEDEGGEYEDE
jgi:hypothetical protein